MNEPKWAHEKWTCNQPPDDICCKNCVFREADRQMGKTVITGHTLDMCKVFEHGKPTDVLWHKELCAYHVSDED